jgi:hypothetical protein
LSSSLIYFWSWKQISIFTVTKLVESQENPWSTALNLVESRDKKVFLLC